MKNTIKREQSPNLFEDMPSVSILRDEGAKNTINREQKQACLGLPGVSILHKVRKIYILMLFVLLPGAFAAQAQEQQGIPFTLEDRDRIIRTEVKLEALTAEMNARFEGVTTEMNARFEGVTTEMNARFESVNSRIDYLFWSLGVLVALSLFTLGYMIWDRRTALKPALDKAFESERKSNLLERVMREYSNDHPDLAKIMRTHGLL